MGTYSNTGVIRQKRDGVAIVYVLAAILVIGFIGTSILVVTQNDLLGAIFGQKATEARFAAKSGIQRLQAELNSDPTKFIPMLEALVSKNTANWWVYGDDESYDSLSPTQRYRLEATDFDSSRNILDVISYGEGLDGKKTVKARLELFHFTVHTKEAVASGSDKDFALYIGDVSTFPMNGPIDIKGNTRFPGNVNFDLLASNSRFRGIFRTSSTNSTQMWRGSYQFDSTAYFGTRVTSDGGLGMTFYDRTGFQDGIHGIGAINSINLHNPTFVAGTVNGGGALSINAHSQRISYGTGFAFSGASWSAYSDGGKVDEDSRWMKDSLGLGESCVPKFDASVIPASKKLSWKWLRDPSRWGYTGPLKYSADASYFVIDQIMANEIYQYAISKGKDWNGIAVVEVDDPMFTKRGIPNNKLDSADLNLKGKSASNSNATFYLAFSAAKSGTYPAKGTSGETISLTTSKPTSSGYMYVDLIFDSVPENFVNGTLSLNFTDIDLHGDTIISGSNWATLHESVKIMDKDSNLIASLGPTYPDDNNFVFRTPLNDSLFKSSELKLICRFDAVTKLIKGTSISFGNSSEKVDKIQIEGQIDTAAATDTSIAVYSKTFNGKMIFIVKSGITLQPTSAGQFFTIDSSANLMVYASPGSAVENIGDWEFFRGYLHVDSAATLSLGGAMNKVDQLMGAVHIRDSAKVKGWYPQNAGVPNIVYDPAVISGMNFDGLMKYECSDDNISGSSKVEVIFIPVAGEDNQKLKSIRY